MRERRCVSSGESETEESVRQRERERARERECERRTRERERDGRARLLKKMNGRAPRTNDASPLMRPRFGARSRELSGASSRFLAHTPRVPLPPKVFSFLDTPRFKKKTPNMAEKRATLRGHLDTMEEFKRKAVGDESEANRSARATMIQAVYDRCTNETNPTVMDAGWFEFDLVIWLVLELRTLYGENAEALRQVHAIGEKIDGTKKMKEKKKVVYTATMNRWNKKRGSVQNLINEAHHDLHHILNTAGPPVAPPVATRVVSPVAPPVFDEEDSPVGPPVVAEEVPPVDPPVVVDVAVEGITKGVDKLSGT